MTLTGELSAVPVSEVLRHDLQRLFELAENRSGEVLIYPQHGGYVDQNDVWSPAVSYAEPVLTGRSSITHVTTPEETGSLDYHDHYEVIESAARLRAVVREAAPIELDWEI